MRFQIPQFIEVEDKIFGPLTLKQFIYMAGGLGISLMFYILFPLYIAVLLIIPALSFAGMLAFYKINNKSFIVIMESAFMYLVHPKLYIWQQQEKPVTPKETTGISEPDTVTSAFIPKLSNSKLKELTWSLDTKEALNPVTKDVAGEGTQVS